MPLPNPTCRVARREPSPLLELGFHGDKYLLSLVDGIMGSVDAFIETGANVGSTARYVAGKYPAVAVYSCEPDPVAFAAAGRNLTGFDNVELYRLASPEFLHVVHAEHPELADCRILYWLDAHGYGFAWPLRDEVEFITHHLKRGVFIVDDCKVPGRAEFCHAVSGSQKCGFAFIQNSLARGRPYHVVYPAYAEHTSPHHPLVGYVVVGFGTDTVAGLVEGNTDFTIATFEP